MRATPIKSTTSVRKYVKKVNPFSSKKPSANNQNYDEKYIHILKQET
jgi:hypothetical protein